MYAKIPLVGEVCLLKPQDGHHINAIRLGVIEVIQKKFRGEMWLNLSLSLLDLAVICLRILKQGGFLLPRGLKPKPFS